MNAPAPLRPGSSFNPTLLLALACLAGWMAGVLWPQILGSIGLVAYGMTYLDSYAILAAVDVTREGGDPFAVNPYDPLGRWHVYSDWWLALRWTGLGRADNFLVGTAWFGSFALSCWLAVRPRNRREAGWMLALLLSPPVLLAFLRANNDLVIFTLVALAAVAAAGAGWLRQLLGAGLVVLATGLKYYPAFAAAGFLWVRPLRRMPVLAGLAVATAGLTLLSVAPQMKRAQFRIDSGVHTMGAPLFGREFGWTDRTSQVVAAVVIVLGAVALVRGRFTTGLAARGEPRERLLAVTGAIVLLACFLAGVNYAYRWIFLFFPAVWIWRQAVGGAGSPREAVVARVACALVLFCVWSDGLLCLFANTVGSAILPRVTTIDEPWRLLTQPLHWALMALLAGWLLEGALATVREWRTERATS